MEAQAGKLRVGGEAQGGKRRVGSSGREGKLRVGSCSRGWCPSLGHSLGSKRAAWPLLQSEPCQAQETGWLWSSHAAAHKRCQHASQEALTFQHVASRVGDTANVTGRADPHGERRRPVANEVHVERDALGDGWPLHLHGDLLAFEGRLVDLPE